MTKLEELIYSLGTLIVRYHDSQYGVTKLITGTKDPILLSRQSRIYAQNLIQNTKNDYKIHFTTLISNCTSAYYGRANFLDFINHEISFLKSIQDKEIPLTEEEFETFNSQLTQLLTEFIMLLNTIKSEQCYVTQNKIGGDTEFGGSISTTVMGLKNNAYVGSVLCNSGIFLSEEVLQPINLHAASIEAEIKATSERICQEHQNKLLVKQLQLENKRLKDLNEVHIKKIAENQTSIKQLETPPKPSPINTDSEDKASIKKLEEENTTLKSEINHLRLQAKPIKSSTTLYLSLLNHSLFFRTHQSIINTAIEFSRSSKNNTI